MLKVQVVIFVGGIGPDERGKGKEKMEEEEMDATVKSHRDAMARNEILSQGSGKGSAIQSGA